MRYSHQFRGDAPPTTRQADVLRAHQIQQAAAAAANQQQRGFAEATRRENTAAHGHILLNFIDNDRRTLAPEEVYTWLYAGSE
ncbi:hypothetical protein PRIPAC_83850 [Pristionchus pacificus]|uniref:Uncharacterized protein n=1 Tax=Pristionchus pacificus TaxID=54126 RepID=A0A2A6BSX0_PRIPA|nr:hypothetical protein PRIPAC_83850 [Pristionchus pacificus]|eukprot:PDM69039.1 hypothetical protein PRIPAC_47341 [Pristionchus pacificus]